jgi:hypothetical protein
MEMGDAVELVDALTGDLLVEPVRAEDGHVYGRRALQAFFDDRRREGAPVVSPQDMTTPMGTTTDVAPPEVAKALEQLLADAALARAPAAPKQDFKTLRELRALFDVLDPLGDLLAKTLDGLQARPRRACPAAARRHARRLRRRRRW